MGPSGLLRRTCGYTCTSDDAAPPLLGSEPNDIADVVQALEASRRGRFGCPTRAGWAASCCSAECKEPVEGIRVGLEHGCRHVWSLAAWIGGGNVAALRV